MIVDNQRVHEIITQMLTVLPALRKKSPRIYSSVCHVTTGMAEVTDGFALLRYKNEQITLPEGIEDLKVNEHGSIVNGFSYPNTKNVWPTEKPSMVLEDKESLAFFESICLIKPTKKNEENCLSFENGRMVYSNVPLLDNPYAKHLRINPNRAYLFLNLMLKTMGKTSLGIFPLTSLSIYTDECMVARFGMHYETYFELILVGIKEVKK